MSALLNAQQSALQQRTQALENTARPATHLTIFTTSGNGHFVEAKPILFDCTFVDEPAIACGMSIVKAPDAKHWQYPVVNTGVYKWIIQKSPSDAGKASLDPTLSPYYVGAYVYAVVKVDPLIYPRTDGSNLANLQAQLSDEQAATSPNADLISALKANIKEAQEAIYLKAHPPKVVIDHHLTFSQVAMKKLPDSLHQNIAVDPTLAPINVTFGLS